jgi:hypothetical protein
METHDQDLRREGSVNRAAEQRVYEDATRRILEAELEDAVVGDWECEGEGQPARPAVEGRNPDGTRPGQLAEDPRRREELGHR